MNFIKKQIK